MACGRGFKSPQLHHHSPSAKSLSLLLNNAVGPQAWRGCSHWSAGLALRQRVSLVAPPDLDHLDTPRRSGLVDRADDVVVVHVSRLGDRGDAGGCARLTRARPPMGTRWPDAARRIYVGIDTPIHGAGRLATDFRCLRRRSRRCSFTLDTPGSRICQGHTP